MTGLPKLPGFAFRDPTLTKFHLSQTFNLCNGYKLPKNQFCGIGGRELDSFSVKHLPKYDVARYDPSLTYGRTKNEALPQFTPHYVLYDQKCLTFRAFFKQPVVESPHEFYRVRHVNIIYFLEDDTITVMEPKTPNSGIDQGRLIRRGKIPKDDRGTYYHWKDLDVGKDLAFYGKVFHTVDCDVFTKEYMASQGLIMGDREEMPVDPYTFNRQLCEKSTTTPVSNKTPGSEDKLRRFLEYDGKVLKFQAVWDDRENEYGELMKFEIMYFLSDDTVMVKVVHGENSGRDPYPVLLRKTKLPKRYTDTPATFPSIYLETTDAEVTEYYQPKDFIIGDTIFVFGRDLLLYDCDKFTREYFRKALCIEQGEALDITEEEDEQPPKQVPPHDGLGSLEDSLQNTLTFLPKPPKKDVMRQILNANKYLRYEMEMDAVHPEDTIRRFVLVYSLADGTCKVIEPPIKNSGILGGTYLKSSLLVKPGSDPLNPSYYTPADFYIGAIITIFSQRFKIVGADLYVYRYMEANENKFPCEVIENLRNYMYTKGYLKDDEKDAVKTLLEKERKWDLDPKGRRRKTKYEECLKDLRVGVGREPEYEDAKMAELRQEYEDSIKYKAPPHQYGIKEVNTTCPYPVQIGDVKDGECTDDIIGQYTSYTPKHIDTEEEKIAKYYTKVLKKQKEICDGSHPIECVDLPPNDGTGTCQENKDEGPKPIMVSPPVVVEGDCKQKKVTFTESVEERCTRDRDDLCDLKREKEHCHCTDYEK
nr:unnamed protein product [Callosobruchus analis]